MTQITIPELSLVALVGVSGSGKSSFAARHFTRTEVLSSDFCRGLVSDDDNDQAATAAAFEILHVIAAKRLEAGRLVVVDATNVQPEARRALIALAKRHHVLAVAIVLDVAESVCAERNVSRPDRDFGAHVLRNQRSQLRRSLSGLRKEGFHKSWVLQGVDEVDAATIERQPLWTDRRSDHGPFDIIGDVHGCYDELAELLDRLGYEVAPEGTDAVHPDGRRAFFVGDLVDRGPATPAVLRLVMGMVDAGHAVCVPGNHESKLLRALRGARVTASHGLAATLDQLRAEPPESTATVAEFIDGLVSHFVLDGGRLVVAHAGLRADMQGRASGAVRSFALYGDTTGETDEYGLPVRYPWAEDYRGDASVVYGHTPVPEATWLNRTICIDTGCVFGGRLTALRWPERNLVSVAARRTYWEPARPLIPVHVDDAARLPTDLDLDDVLGKRIIDTRLSHRVTIREENAIAALEVMSRFAADPRWLVYLPPTMAPTATTEQPSLLEHPAEAFASYRRDGVRHVVCQEKHMGSRAVVAVCRSTEAADDRFGVADSSGAGAIVTRTGRPFLTGQGQETALLAKVRSGLTAAGLWDELSTDWLVLDCELLPWSAKQASFFAASTPPSEPPPPLPWTPRPPSLKLLPPGALMQLSLPSCTVNGTPWPMGSSTPTAVTAGRSTPSTTSASPPSRSSPGREGCTPSPTTPGTSIFSAGCAPPIPGPSGPPWRSLSTSPTTLARRRPPTGGCSSPQPAAKEWSSNRSTQPTMDLAESPSPGSSAGAGSTSASSMARNTPQTPTCRGCGAED